jgi:hypothetical protein
MILRFEGGNRKFIGGESGTAKCRGNIEGSEEIGGWSFADSWTCQGVAVLEGSWNNGVNEWKWEIEG